jgi:SAM-dependent methyltransferase
MLFKSKIPWYVQRALKGVQPGVSILEAGCGSGFVANALARRGYRVSGVDYAQKTIVKLKEIYPDINFSFGDVRGLGFPDSSFGVYLSLGVIEHFIDEKDASQAIKEAIRLTKRGGIVLFTVPFTNRLRQNKMSANVYPRARSLPDEFYQRSYTVSQLKNLFLGSPLVLKDIIYYGSEEGVAREVDGLSFIRDSFIASSAIKILERFTGIGKICGHMLGFKFINNK